MKFTIDQRNASSNIINFIDGVPDPEDNEAYLCTLSGFAGTGKTTLINHIIQQRKFKIKIVVSATTHKAKEVIADVTKQNADTIHSLLGLRPNEDLEDFNPNKPTFKTLAQERLSKYDVVFIDECSMMNAALFTMIKEKAIEHKTKIIFIGDVYQTPPVGEAVSKVFKIKRLYQLNEIVRQSGTNPNQLLIELARNDIRDNTDTLLTFLKTNESKIVNEEGYKILTKDNYYESLLEYYYDSEYQQNPNVMKTIAWTNKSVSAINNYLRAKIINSIEMVAVGDILMGYKTIGKEIDTPPFFLATVKNSVDYIVTKVTPTIKTLYGTEFKGYLIETKDNDETMFILHRDSYNIFRESIIPLYEAGVMYRQWKKYYDFKNNFVLLETIHFGTGFNEKCDKDIDYGYAITVHKCQGSTYQNVGVTLKDIMNNRTVKERRQLIYVALSRVNKINCIYL